MVFSKATEALGSTLGMKRVAALGFRHFDQEVSASSSGGEQEEDEQMMKAKESVQDKMRSFLDFVRSKKGLINLWQAARNDDDDDGRQEEDEMEDDAMDEA